MLNFVRRKKYTSHLLVLLLLHTLYWASIPDIPCAPMSHTSLTGCSMSTVTCTLTSVPDSEQEVASGNMVVKIANYYKSVI